jgi:hypothetical protein
MAIELYCPHCHGALRLPDDCGGQSTHCPHCLKPFQITADGKAAVAPTAVVASLPQASSVTPEEIERAGAKAAALASELQAAHFKLAKRHRRRQAQTARLAILRRFETGRGQLDRSVGRIGGFFVALAIGAALTVLVAHWFSVSSVGYLIAGLIGVLCAGTVYAPFAFLPSDPTLKLAIAIFQPQLEDTMRECEADERKVARLSEQATAADVQYVAIAQLGVRREKE